MEHLLLIAAACLTFAGCAATSEVGEEQGHVGRSIQPIVGGIASGSDQDAVVVLARFENGVRVGLCTATLVAPNLAVTARHCVSASDAVAACGADGLPVSGALLHGDRDPGSLAVFATTAGAAPDTTADIGSSAHGKALVVDASTTICNHDLAFVILDKSVTAPIAPIRLGPPAAADALTAVGFGITEMGALPTSRMQRNGISLVGAGPMPYPDDARYGVGDGEFLVGESACAGDSGSPAFAKSGAVIGVASRAGNGLPRDPNNAASTCLGATAHVAYAELGASQALVTRAFKEAGATPWLEGEPDPRIKKSPPPSSSGASSSSGSSGATNAAPAAPAAPPGPAAPPPSTDGDGESGGCSASGTPVRGAVEDALGVVAVVLLMLRLRSRTKKKAKEAERTKDGRVPYVDLGMRESLASFSDDR